MADTIKIGNLDISAFKVGSDDCKVYLGDTLLYPQSTTPNYFRFVAREDGQFKLSGNSVTYSLDSGTTWTSLASDTYSPTVSSGNCIMLKATNPTLVSGGGIGKFISTGQFDVEGNIMSLVYGDDFETATTLSNNGQFRSLFDSNTNVINASGLTLPSTNAPQDAYRSLFYNCTNLVTAPLEFPATTLGESCYKYAFRYCSSLTNVPTLPATNISQSCYANIFQGCTSLTSVPSNYLPATTVYQQCYSQMFQGCTNLTTAPELPATTLADRCYRNMFYGCTSLTTAPVLSATTLASQCYSSMFQGCTSLNSIKCLATDISAVACTTNWVNGVASSGTFTKVSSMSSWTTGYNGIPSNWTVEDYSS